ncbi:MAG: UDP-N-acetylmuramate--alanine ligase [Chitinivibrionales bacterium]|nr:UDP-N-acetylmuramate--alanine ligase [Chitinivibrionales bacterium]
MSLSINEREYSSFHFIGILGSGMSALAQYCVWNGYGVSGSDRMIQAPEAQRTRTCLEALGCNVFTQDGSGIGSATQAVIVSTAIEDSNPDISQAAELNLPVFHRSELLAAIVNTKKTIAVAGTSGKSTVCALVFELLCAAGNNPSLISGAPLNRLEAQGHIGNAWLGTSDLLVVEADESDGSLVRYHPAVTVFLNVSKDHQDVDQSLELFATLAQQSQRVLRNEDQPMLKSLRADMTFGWNEQADVYPDSVAPGRLESTLRVHNVEYRVPLPGRHNLDNALAALAVCSFVGCNMEKVREGLSRYRGIARRFTLCQVSDDIVVVDDFAHNPDKIAAALRAAHSIGQRVIAIYQPHGFKPTAFMRRELVDAFAAGLNERDLLLLLPIYYAGGTAQKSISSADLARDLSGVSRAGISCPQSKDSALALIRSIARTGDCIISMGARDPGLSAFAGRICALFSGG